MPIRKVMAELRLLRLRATAITERQRRTAAEEEYLEQLRREQAAIEGIRSWSARRGG